MAIDDKLPFRCVNILDKTLEMVIVLIKFDNKNVIISYVYIANKAVLEVYSTYFNIINNIYIISVQFNPLTANVRCLYRFFLSCVCLILFSVSGDCVVIYCGFNKFLDVLFPSQYFNLFRQ